MYVIEKRGDWSPLMGRSGSYAVYGTKTTAEAVVKTLSPQEMYRVAKYIHKPGDPYASRPKVNVKAWYPDGRVEKYHFWGDVDWDRLRRETIGDGAIAAYVSSSELKHPLKPVVLIGDDAHVLVLMSDTKAPFAAIVKSLEKEYCIFRHVLMVRHGFANGRKHLYIVGSKSAADQFDYDFGCVFFGRSIAVQSTPTSAHKPGDPYDEYWEYTGELRVPMALEYYEPRELKGRGGICWQSSSILTQNKPCEILRPRKVGRDDNW